LLKLWISFHSPVLLLFISTLITKDHTQMKFITRIYLMLLALKIPTSSLCHLWLACSISRGYCQFVMIFIVVANNHIVFFWFIWGNKKSCQETNTLSFSMVNRYLIRAFAWLSSINYHSNLDLSKVLFFQLCNLAQSKRRTYRIYAIHNNHFHHITGNFSPWNYYLQQPAPS